MIIRSPSIIALLSLSTSLELVSKISAHDIFVEEGPEVEASQSVFSSNLLPPVETEDDDEDNHRYIIKFVDDSPVFLNRLDNARRKLADDSGRIRDHFIPFENAEIAYLKSEKEVEDWENNIEVEYVIKDTKVYPHAEVTPGGILQVNALDVSDSLISERTVCIIDTGYDINHPDLPKGSSVTGSEGVAGPWNQDFSGHGTHVAGVIAAIGGNNQGVVGVNRNGQLKLHIVRVFNDNNEFAWASGIVNAAEECAKAGANVINMSFGGTAYNSLENSVYQRMYNDGVLIIASAGNTGDGYFNYPAAYESVMSVAAIDKNNNVASFSTRNVRVNIAAPGVNIFSTIPNNRYRNLSGTSMAAPHVAGVAALIWSHYPTKPAIEVRSAMEESAIDLGDPGWDISFGHGLVQADKALLLLGAECVDAPFGWHDDDGADYNCAWYTNNFYCQLYGNDYPGTGGKTATQACCGCGGGFTNSITRTPTASPVRGSPTQAPSKSPTKTPTKETIKPTNVPTKGPTKVPSKTPSKAPTEAPSKGPTKVPTDSPTNIPTKDPTNIPSREPTKEPTKDPTKSPSKEPTKAPTKDPTKSPSKEPTKAPTKDPTNLPTKIPSREPTKVPTKDPTGSPTHSPTKRPSKEPTKIPTKDPTNAPTHSPTKVPTKDPTNKPTFGPSKKATSSPSSSPTFAPTKRPTEVPSEAVTKDPTNKPTVGLSPTISPSLLSKQPFGSQENSTPKTSGCSIRLHNLSMSLGIVLYTLHVVSK